MNRHLASFLLVLPLLLLACSQEDSNPSTSSYSVRIEQSDGQILELTEAPTRIVSLAADATEILCAIGAGDLLMAVEKYANCPDGSKAKPEVDSFQPNLEAIAGFRPDLVYVFSDQGGIVEALRRTGTPVLYLKSPQTLDIVYEHIELLGRVTSHQSQASELVKDLKQRQQAVTDKLASTSTGPRIFHELSEDYYTVTSDSFIGELYTLLKARNIADGASSAYPQLSAEEIVQRDPEVIVLTDGASPDLVSQRAGWSAISAVKNNRLCEIDGDLVSRGSQKIIDGLEALSLCLYPQNQR